MRTYCQELHGNKLNVYLEYLDDGTLRAVFNSPNRVIPSALHGSIPLPMIHTSDREIRYWIERAKNSVRVFYYE